MKKIAVVLAVLAMALTASAVVAKEWKKVRVAIEGAYPPFSSVDPDGTLVGFDVDIAKALGEAMGAEVVLVAQDWDGMIPALLARKYDAIVASMSITEERLKKVAFSNKYYSIPAKFACKNGFMPEFSEEALKGKKVGVQRETVHDKFLTEKFGKNVDIKRYGSLDEAVLDLTAGRVDMLLADSAALSDGFLKKEEGKDYGFVGPDYADPEWFGEGIGVAIRKGDADLVEKFNKAIDDIRANGKYKEIQDKYFDFNVYGDE